MISRLLQAAGLAGIIVYFILIFYLLKKKSLELKYTVKWILFGLFLLIIDFFPAILGTIADCIGIETPSNALIVIVVFFILTVLITQTSTISKQNSQIKDLSQAMGLLEKELGDLKASKGDKEPEK